MVHSVIYAMRGWIAFVAFIEFSNSMQCFIGDKQILYTALEVPNSVDVPMSRLMGRYCLLNSVIMGHCALCIEHIPIIVLSIFSLTFNILMYGSEAFYYYTATVNFNSVFPLLISSFTIICLMIAPFFIEYEPKKKKSRHDDDDDEEEDYEMKMINKKSQHHQLRNHHKISGAFGANRLKKTL